MPECLDCGQQFSREFSLKRHESSHHGREQHQCSDCLKVYARRDNLQKHKRRCHMANSDSGMSAILLPTPMDREPQDSRQVLEPSSSVGPTPSVPLFAAQDTVLLGSAANQPVGSGFASSQDLRATFGTLPDPVHYDSLGRVDLQSRNNPESNLVPSPDFLVTTTSNLQYEFPNARIESKMLLCPVHHVTLEPIFDHWYPIDSTMFKYQYVPSITCMDCPNVTFPIQPHDSSSAVEGHLSGPLHARRVRLRWIAESETAQEALLTTVGPASLLAWVTKLADQRLSLSQLDEQYLAQCGQPLLVLAVKKGAIHVLRHALDEELKVTVKDSTQRSALHWACALGRSDMAELLIRYGARLNDKDIESETPIDLAIKALGLHSATDLIKAEAKFRREESPIMFDTPLNLACRYGQAKIIEWMVSNGVDIDQSNLDSSLAVSIRRASCEVVRILLIAGATAVSIPILDQLMLKLEAEGTHLSCDYLDAEEKIDLLKHYGLSFELAVPESQHI